MTFNSESFVFQQLQKLNKSTFRARFKLSLKDITYIHQKGIGTIKEHAYDFLSKRLAPSFIKNDGKQTPMRGHPVFVAQHATATCCRDCLYKWHRIEKNKELNKDELDFCVNIIMAWIKLQLEKSV